MSASIHAHGLAQILASLEQQLGLLGGALVSIRQVVGALRDEIAVEAVHGVKDRVEAAHAEVGALDGHEQQVELHAQAQRVRPQRIELSPQALEMLEQLRGREGFIGIGHAAKDSASHAATEGGPSANRHAVEAGA